MLITRRSIQERKEIKQFHKDIKEWRRYTYRSRGASELISQGLLILERLTQDEEEMIASSAVLRLLTKVTCCLFIHFDLSPSFSDH
jgi:hypothetical protein